MGARWVVVYDLRSQKLMQFVFYQTCCVNDTMCHVGKQSNSIGNPQHVWCYESLEARQAAREVVWQATQEQWQEIVARTVPLIR